MKTKLIILFMFLCLYSSAQVTIGTDELPTKGSLLQLKNIPNVTGNSTNATKGLLLPRVAIKDIKSLADIPHSEDSTQLVGLLVYNVHSTDLACDQYVYKKGVFLWNGIQWKALNGEITYNPNYYEGSYQEDLAALKNIYDSNKSNTLKWKFSGTPGNLKIEGDSTTILFVDVCGQKRVARLDVHGANLTTLDCRKLTYLQLLYAHDNSITDVNISQSKILRYLNLSWNQLTKLDITNNPVLYSLYCTNNEITNIDFSNNDYIAILDVSKNSLSSISLINNTELTDLTIGDNPLTNMPDFTYNSKIMTLSICNVGTYLGAIDLTNLAKLKTFQCDESKFSGTLDLTKNIALETLSCSKNEFSGNLDLTQNPLLTTVVCDYNNFTGSLNLEFNEDLVLFTCKSNEFTGALNLSNNTLLSTFECNGNRFTGSLDLSSNVYMKVLRCTDSGLSGTLDLSSNSRLQVLMCNDNYFEGTLNLSNNKKLTSITCGKNMFSGELNLSNNPLVETLLCADNQFTSIILTNPSVLSNGSLDCSENKTLGSKSVKICQSVLSKLKKVVPAATNVIYDAVTCN